MAEVPTIKMNKGSANIVVNESDRKRFEGMGYKLVADKPTPEPKHDPKPDPESKDVGSDKAAKADTPKPKK